VCWSRPAKSTSNATHDVPPGARDPAAIQSIVREQYDAIRECYTDALWRRPDATGRVEVRFVIAESGEVTNACVQPPVFVLIPGEDS
jgi:hypothetical protein